jgi:ribosomal protein S19E (S16A)
MKPDAGPIVEPLTETETAVLKAYAERDSEKLSEVDASEGEPRVAWAIASQALVRKGFLVKHERGMLVSPEGLAALLDTVPVEVMRTASQSAAP